MYKSYIQNSRINLVFQIFGKRKLGMRGLPAPSYIRDGYNIKVQNFLSRFKINPTADGAVKMGSVFAVVKTIIENLWYEFSDVGFV
jgi:hypothetical protein